MRGLLLALSIGCAAAGAVRAADVAQDSVEKVQVAGLRGPALKNYRQFVRGLDVFEEKHALAPDALPLFRLIPAARGSALEGVTMRIASDTSSMQVPVNPDGTFAMPRSQAAIDEDADIFLNKKRGSYLWRPQFVTPNLPPNTRRLGDLRLECEVFWAVGRDEISLVARGIAATAGGPCSTRALKVMQWAPRPLMEYTLVSGSRRQRFSPPPVPADSPLPLYWVPLHDSSWPDDALIEFVYAPQA